MKRFMGIALVGMVLLLFPVGVLLLRSPYFAGVRGSAPLARGRRREFRLGRSAEL